MPPTIPKPVSGKLPSKVLEAAAGKLADLNLKVETKTSTIPVTVINTVTGAEKVIQLTLSHNGDFPFPLTLRLDADKDNAGLFTDLYYYNENEKALEYQTTTEIDSDGNADILFAHTSGYAVIIDEVSHAPNPFTDVREGERTNSNNRLCSYITMVSENVISVVNMTLLHPYWISGSSSQRPLVLSRRKIIVRLRSRN